MNRRITPVIKKRGRWYVAYVKEIRGVNTQGRTLKNVRRNLREALELLLECRRKLCHFEPRQKASG